MRAERCCEGFAALEADLRERQASRAGAIRLASTFGFGRAVARAGPRGFPGAAPAAEVELQLTEQLPDLARTASTARSGCGRVRGRSARPTGVSRRLARNQRVLVAAPAYLRAARHAGAAAEDLAQHDCLIVRENTEQRVRRLDAGKASATAADSGCAVAGPLSSNSGELVRDWCLAGRGIMLRSLWDIAPQLARGQLVRVLPCLCDAPTPTSTGWRRTSPRSPRRIRLLVDFLAERFRGRALEAQAGCGRRAGAHHQATPSGRERHAGERQPP